MRALLVSSDNIYLVPYLNMYEAIFKCHDIDYDVIYWDKSNQEPANQKNFIRFTTSFNQGLKKIYGYYQFRKRVLKLCKQNQYDLVVPLHAICNLILYDLLTGRFKKRYIFDVRDYSYEKYAIVRRMQKNLADNSMMNIISSDGYKSFLPAGEYFTVHNFSQMDYVPFRQKENSEAPVIQLSYIGLIRFMEQNKKIIKFFENDPRFHLNFYGTNAKQLESFCQENGITNVSLVDTFNPSQTLKFYKDTDLVMNLYGNHTPLLDYALSNKLYLAACLYKPILVCEDTYMEKISQQYGFGFTLKMSDPSEKDQLYRYIKNMDRLQLIENCDRFIAYVEEQNRLLYRTVGERITALQPQTPDRA